MLSCISGSKPINIFALFYQNPIIETGQVRPLALIVSIKVHTYFQMNLHRLLMSSVESGNRSTFNGSTLPVAVLKA